MRHVARIRVGVAAAVLLLLLGSCMSTMTLVDDYTLDARYFDVPVMLNKPDPRLPGRRFTATVSHDSATTMSSYSGPGYHVDVTTTTARQTTLNNQDQIMMRLLADDSAIYVNGMDYVAYILMAPYHGENAFRFGVDVIYVKELDR
ncbi:MAG: hypothetical protein ACOC2Y_08020 [Spirochaetota bacterium]